MHELKAHSIYLTGNKPSALPDKIAVNLASFKKCYADFEHQLYTDDSLREFIQKNHPPEVLWAYDQLIPLAYKADLGRYCLLYQLGGIYADLSITFFQRVWLDDFPDTKLFLFRDAFSHAPWIVSNSILMARPGQFIFKHLIDKIVEHVKIHFYGFNPLCPTGPNLMGRAAAQLLEMADFATGEVVRINKNTNTWSYSYLIPSGEVLAVNVKLGNGLMSLGHANSDNYNEHWSARRIYKNEWAVGAVSHTAETSYNAEQKINSRGFSLRSVQEFEESIEHLREQLARAESRAVYAEAQTAKLNAQLIAQSASFYRSKSWRVTALLRWVYGPVRRLKLEGFKSRVKAFGRKKLFKINNASLLRPSLRHILISISKLIGVNETLKNFLRKAQEQALIDTPGTHDYGWIDPSYRQTIEVVNGERYEVIIIDSMMIYFHAQVFCDARGIGRHARELITELRKKSRSNIFAENNLDKTIYFFSTIHWCPKVLPLNSVVLIHDITPILLPEIFGELTEEIKTRCENILKSSRQIITISNSSKFDISKYFNFEAEKIKVITNGVSQFNNEIKPSVNIPISDYFVFMGTADLHKNINVVFEAIKKNQNLKLVLIGDEGAFRKSMARHADIPSHSIYVAGRLSDAEAAYVIRRSIAMVFPSLYEGFGLPPLEAALQGIPSICSKRPAMTEILSDAAIFADPYEPTQWLDAMNMLKNDHDMRNELAFAAKNKALSYTWQKTASQIIDLFRELQN
jgi:glycosyltransferase involved in cell wall biosynthesis